MSSPIVSPRTKRRCRISPSQQADRPKKKARRKLNTDVPHEIKVEAVLQTYKHIAMGKMKGQAHLAVAEALGCSRWLIYTYQAEGGGAWDFLSTTAACFTFPSGSGAAVLQFSLQSFSPNQVPVDFWNRHRKKNNKAAHLNLPKSPFPYVGAAK